MKARYILRFDDICPTMDWTIWEKLEPILLKHDIKPILAVVPDNQDPKLMVDTVRDNFWDRVRGWQAAGWTIALHGHQHVYTSKNSGLTKINNYSEFVGLSYEAQYDKINRGLKIFEEEGVRADAWIAPAHSFDEVTVKALLANGISVISDGFYFSPVNRLGALWIPQQLWHFRKMHFGLWTVCYHHNIFLKQEEIDYFEKSVMKFAPFIISFKQAIEDYPAKEYDSINKATEVFWRMALKVKSRLQNYTNQH